MRKTLLVVLAIVLGFVTNIFIYNQTQFIVRQDFSAVPKTLQNCTQSKLYSVPTVSTAGEPIKEKATFASYVTDCSTIPYGQNNLTQFMKTLTFYINGLIWVLMWGVLEFIIVKLYADSRH